MTLEEQLAEAQANIESAEGERDAAKAELVTAEAARDEAVTAKETAEGERDEAIADKDAAETLASEAESAKVAAEGELAAANAKIVTLEAKDRDIDAEVAAEVAKVAKASGGAPLENGAKAEGDDDTATAKTRSLDEHYAEVERLENSEGPEAARAYYVEHIQSPRS